MIGFWLRLWGPVLLIGTTVSVFSHMSHPPGPALAPDWVLHGVEYGALGFSMARALAGGLGRAVSRRVVFLTLAVGLVYGVADEIHQSFVPYRDASVHDVVADVGGTLLGLGLVSWLSGQRRSAPPESAEEVQVTLVTGPDCPLCHEARTALGRISSVIRLRVEEHSIDMDERLASLYGDEIPVVLCGGKKLSKGKVNPDRLMASLAARSSMRG
ncbi:MAG: VanZ family protein [Acidobacteriota bacterium]